MSLQLLQVIEYIFQVEPTMNESLIALLEETAWKDTIGLDHEASELVVNISGGRTDTMLYQFRPLCGVINQIKTTNRPQITKEVNFRNAPWVDLAILVSLPDAPFSPRSTTTSETAYCLNAS